MSLKQNQTPSAAKTVLAVGLLSIAAWSSYASNDHDKSSKTVELKANIVDTAIKAGSFHTLAAAAQAGGLEETLRSD